MYKRILVLFLAMGFSSCALFYPPVFYEKVVSDPFQEIGAVLRLQEGNNTSTADVAGALYYAISQSSHSNSIFIAFDFTDSALKPSEYTNHQPILVGNMSDFINWHGSAYNMAFWDSLKDYLGVVNNNLWQSPINENVYVMELYIPVTGTLASTTNLYGGSGSYDVLFRPANFLNTPSGRTAIQTSGSKFWETIGLMDMAGFNFHVVLTNISGNLFIHYFNVEDGLIELSRPPFVPTQGTYVTADKKGVGIKVNGLLEDWTLQGKGDKEIPAKTKIRFIVENLPAGDLVPYNGSLIWTDWPSGLVMTGNQTWLHSENIIWKPEKAKSVYVDRALGKGVSEIILPFSVNPTLLVKYANIRGFQGYISEGFGHPIYLPQPINGAITVIMQSRLMATNL